MKITFTYQSIVSGSCVIEIEDGKEILSINVKDDTKDEDLDYTSKNLNKDARYIFHTSELEIYYPIISSTCKAFYSNILTNDLKTRNISESSQLEDKINIRTLSDSEDVYLDSLL